MKYREEFDNAWACSQNIFDLAVCCYEELKKEIGAGASFIAIYMDSPARAERSNPNRAKLNQLTNDVIGLFMKEPDDFHFAENKNAVYELLSALSLKPFEDDALNHATPLMAVLRGIDFYVAKVLADQRARWNLKTPLNTIHRDSFAVYLQMSDSLLSKCRTALRFRKIPRDHGLRESLHGLLILRADELAEGASFPRIVSVPLNEERNEIIAQNIRTHCMKVMVLPFSSDRTFEFVPHLGSTFQVS